MNTVRQIVYLHGVPGSARELELFDVERSNSDMEILVPDRHIDNEHQTLIGHFKRLAEEIENRFPNGEIELIGFSLGTYIAMQVAPHLSHRIKALHLISSVAPLQWGPYLDDMAGKAVFEMAIKFPRVFSFLISVQSVLARYCPKLLVSALFANVQGDDKGLVENQKFRTKIAEIVKESVGTNKPTYRLEIGGFVLAWEPLKHLQNLNISFWHGAEDNWSPVQMVRDQQQYFGDSVEVNIMPQLSHYSTLAYALNQIVFKPA